MSDHAKDPCIAESVTADFTEGTWLFEPIGKFRVGAGRYAIIPECDYLELQQQRDELLAALEGLTNDIQSLIGESHGVVGFHRNGDIAPWNELEAGGRFERLTHLPDAIAAIAKAKEGEQ